METKCGENQSRARLSLGLFILTTILVWVVTGCGGKTPTPIAAVQPPEISEPKVGAPTPLKPGEEAGISVEVSKATGVALTYTWTADGGEIVRGQESPAITYRAPDEPGTYNVRVVVTWDDQSVEKATSIKVEEPTPTPTSTPTDTPVPPTDTPVPPTDTPVPPTDTPVSPAAAPTNTPKPATATPSVILTPSTGPQWTFESGTTEGWVAATGPDWTDNYALGATVTSEKASEGQYSLKCDLDGTSVPSDQFYKAIFYIERQLDMDPCSKLVFDVHNSIDGMKVAISLSTGPEWVWHESPSIPLGTGWNKDITFDLDATNFKTEASGWSHSVPMADKNDTKRLAVIFIPPKRPLAGSLYLDAIVPPIDTPVPPTATPVPPPPPPCQSTRPPLDGPPANVEVQITSPRHCDTGLATTITAGGTYSGDLTGKEIWILVYPTDLKYYAQSLGACEGIPVDASGGIWNTTVHFGGPPQQFDVVAVVTDTGGEASQEFKRWLQRGCETGDFPGYPRNKLPGGITEVDAITVSTAGG